MRPHDLRHTHVALLIAAGEGPFVISRRPGPASIRTTYDVYGHLFECPDHEASAALEAARAQSRRLPADSRQIGTHVTRALNHKIPAGTGPRNCRRPGFAGPSTNEPARSAGSRGAEGI